MNYIKQLQYQRDASNVCIKDAYDNLIDFKSYLMSNKFHNDPTIQVQDVLNRLEHIENCLRESYFDDAVDILTSGTITIP